VYHDSEDNLLMELRRFHQLGWDVADDCQDDQVSVLTSYDDASGVSVSQMQEQENHLMVAERMIALSIAVPA